jgi:hypothetical protein
MGLGQKDRNGRSIGRGEATRMPPELVLGAPHIERNAASYISIEYGPQRSIRSRTIDQAILSSVHCSASGSICPSRDQFAARTFTSETRIVRAGVATIAASTGPKRSSRASISRSIVFCLRSFPGRTCRNASSNAEVPFRRIRRCHVCRLFDSRSQSPARPRSPGGPLQLAPGNLGLFQQYRSKTDQRTRKHLDINHAPFPPRPIQSVMAQDAKSHKPRRWRLGRGWD